MGMVQDPVQRCRCQRGVATESLFPFPKAQIRSQDVRARFIPFGYERKPFAIEINRRSRDAGAFPEIQRCSLAEPLGIRDVGRVLLPELTQGTDADESGAPVGEQAGWKGLLSLRCPSVASLGCPFTALRCAYDRLAFLSPALIKTKLCHPGGSLDRVCRQIHNP